MAIKWDTGPTAFERDPRWRWRAWGYVVEGDFWPYRMEVRLKATPCHHDEKPSDWDDSGLLVWEPSACDCWDNLRAAPSLDEMPAGGLSARMLRDVRLGEAGDGWRRAAENARTYGLTPSRNPGTAAAWDREVARGLDREEGPRFVERGPGRPTLPPETHLRRLAVLLEEYDKGHTQKAAAKRLRVSEPTLRVSLEWARRHGLWSPAVNGRKGEPTAAGVEAIGPFRSKAKSGGKR